MTVRKSTTEEIELQAPQTIEAYREARSSKSAADKRAYLLEQQLEAARRSNGLMVEQMHADRDRAAALSADLDDMRAEHEAALAIVQTALDEANRKIVALEGQLKAALTSRVDAFKALPEGSPMKREMYEPLPTAEPPREYTLEEAEEIMKRDPFARFASIGGAIPTEYRFCQEEGRMYRSNSGHWFPSSNYAPAKRFKRLRDAVTSVESVMEANLP